jgi:hypothetical protein
MGGVGAAILGVDCGMPRGREGLVGESEYRRERRQVGRNRWSEISTPLLALIEQRCK